MPAHSPIDRPSPAPPKGAVDATATPTDPGKQSRVASHIPVVAAFDGYRAYAILGIVVFHLLDRSGVITVAGSNWFAWLIQGTLGQFVDILFIISGFVVFLPTVARHGEFGSVSSFAVRRAARLVPAYWAVLAILLVLIAVDPPIPFPGIGDIAIHAAYLQMPAEVFRNLVIGFGVDGPLWTLSLEVTFYFILPFVAAWYFRRPLVGLLIAAAITVVWHEALIHWSTTEALLGHPSPQASLRLEQTGYRQFPYFAFSFGAGMTGAWAYVRLRERHRPEQLARHVGWVQLVSFTSLAVFCYMLGSRAVDLGPAARNSPIIALGFTGSLTTLMVATALGPMRWQRPFAHPFARWLGDISYGMYLIHAVIATYAFRLLFTPATPPPLRGDGSFGTFVALVALVVPLTVLYGYVSGRYLEQPIRRWAQRFGRRQQDRAASTRAAAKVPTGG